MTSNHVPLISAFEITFGMTFGMTFKMDNTQDDNQDDFQDDYRMMFAYQHSVSSLSVLL